MLKKISWLRTGLAIIVVVVLILLAFMFSKKGQPSTTQTNISASCQKDSNGLPPDPGEAGKKTLTGIDCDNDGLRDDIQRYIALTYPDSEKTRAALTQDAKATQAFLLDANDKAASIRHAQEASYAHDCLSYIYGIGTDATRAIANRLRAQLLNTDERSRAYFIANDQLGGQSYPSVPLAERQLRCNFDPDAMRN